MRNPDRYETVESLQLHPLPNCWRQGHHNDPDAAADDDTRAVEVAEAVLVLLVLGLAGRMQAVAVPYS